MSNEDEEIDYNQLNQQDQDDEDQNQEKVDQVDEQENEGQEDNNNEENQNNENNGEEAADQEQPKDDEQEQTQEGTEQVAEQQQNEEIEQQGQDEQQMENQEIDKRSVYVQNVDYQSTKDDIIEHFKDVGEIHRVTILKDKYSGAPIGGCYIEFKTEESVEYAKVLTDSMLRGRQIKVNNKRTNIPNFHGNKRGRGRGGRRPNMGFQPMFYARGNYMMAYRGRGRGRGGYRPH